MKKLFVSVCVMLLVRSVFGQTTQSVIFTETTLINETFNGDSSSYNLLFNNYYLHVSNYCNGVSSIESPNPIDGSQYLLLGSNSSGLSPWIQGNDCGVDVVFSPVDLTPYDLVKVSFECNFSANTSWDLVSQMSNGGWNVLAVYWSGGGEEQINLSASSVSGWYVYEVYLSSPMFLLDGEFNMVLNVYDDTPNGSTSFVMDNFKVVGYNVGGVVEPEPQSQGCGYDADGDGTISTIDLLEFLMWYGVDVDC